MEKYYRLSNSQLQKRLDSEISRLASEGEGGQERLMHELSVYQIELEMQNRELRQAQEELEQAREHYAHLYDFAPIGYLTLDRQGYIKQMNRAATEILGKSSSVSSAHPLAMHLIPADVNKLMDHFHRLMAGEGRVTSEFQFRTEGERAARVVRADSTVSVKDATEPEILMSMVDLTEQKIAQAEAREQRDALLHAGRLAVLAELSSGIAHEINQPIAAIKMFARSLDNLIQSADVSQSDLSEITKKIIGQSERAGDIVRRIRDFSRKQDLQRSQDDISDVTKEAVDFIEPMLQQNNAKVMVHETGTILPVYIDRVQVIQVLVNLISNACEAMRNNAAEDDRIIKVDVCMPDRSYVEVAIEDEGPGFSQQAMKHMFMPFFSTREDGLGLGLSLCQKIILIHDGHMWIDNKKDRGAVVHFTLPTAGKTGE